MDAFQAREAKRTLLAKNIVISWAIFRSALESLLHSYNETQQGTLHPAKLDPVSDDTTIVISSGRGMAKDEFNTVVIVITIRLDKGEYLISARKETWLSRQQVRISKANKDDLYEFTLDGDPENGELWLASTEFGRCTPSKAAESLLVKTLA
jgi:hypothetical protein